MKTTSLCYHDVLPRFRVAAGPLGAGASRYNLEAADFRTHLEQIEEEVLANDRARRPGLVLELLQGTGRRQGCLLTFDNAGSNAASTIAPLLEHFGWRGHFFVAADSIGKPGFLTRDQIRELRRRGHVIGSHGCSHDVRMSVIPVERLVQEWGFSRQILSEILGEEVTAASVPSGHYSTRVAKAAAVVGFKAIFTQEPTAHVAQCGGCLVFGRYLVRSDTPARTAARLAVGSICSCARQWVLWTLKRPARSALDSLYPRMRKAYFSWQRSEQ
jgi:peptidoglycan/xylan/chitin deacetylase (PgdA/CDA1 family)